MKKEIREIWKAIPNYEGKYEVSNIGNVKSLARITITKSGKRLPIKQMILKQTLTKNGYLKVNLHYDGKKTNREIHTLMVEAFYGIKTNYKIVVNHKDFDRTNNVLDNFEIVKARVNTNKKHIKSTSKYVGVSWKRANNKWCAQILHNCKQKHIGLFESEKEAAKAYNEYKSKHQL